MTDGSGSIHGFWKELKNRKVFHGITVYVAVAFGLMELIDIITGPLHLPGWVLTVVILLSAAGFPVAALLSWMYDLTPAGIKRYGHRKEESVTRSGAMEPVPLEETTGDTGPDGQLVVAPAGITEQPPVKTAGKHTGRIYGISSVIVMGIVFISFLFFSGKAAPFKERDWVVIADFVNHTQETVFDKSLSTAFEIGIDQSRYINVFPRRRISETLKRMGKDADAFVDEELCREIATREGIKIYIIPEISRVGQQYILTCKLQEARSGSMYRSEIIYADQEGEIIHQLDKLVRKMRRNLGESRYKISGQGKPLVRVTTSSMDALKQFSLGIESHTNLEFEKAVEYYRNAIRIDSTFTAAKASLGNILYERFDKNEGRKWLEEAIASIDDLTDREKNGIMAFYAANIENDLEKSIAYTKLNIELYPDDPINRNNLGWYLQNLKKYEEAAVEYEAAIRLDPYTLIPYGGLNWICLSCLGQYDSAMYWANQMIRYGPENPWGYCYLGSAHVGKGEYQEAIQAFLKAREVNPRLTFNLYRLAYTYRIVGMPQKSAEILNEVLRISPNEYSAHYNLGISYELMGDQERAREHFLKSRSVALEWEMAYPDLPATYVVLGVTLTRLGEKEAGWEKGKKAIEMDSAFHFRYAEFLAVQDRKEEALDHLEKALENGYRDLPWILMNPDIALLKDEKRYRELLEKYFQFSAGPGEGV